MNAHIENLIIDVSRCSPLGSAFVLNAIQHYAKECIDSGLTDWSDHSLVSKDLWLDIARQALDITEYKEEV